jgi:hypothetical protein
MEPIELPGGFHDAAGRRHRLVELAPLRGREEELLVDRSGSAAAKVTLVLQRCARIRGLGPLDLDMARSLTVGDRQFLLMKLRELTLGSDVSAVTSCPWWGCNQRVDVDFSLADIPVRLEADGGPIHAFELSEEAAFVGQDGALHRTVLFRLPNGGDQEALAQLAEANQAAAFTKLLERCVVSVGSARPLEGEVVDGLSARARWEIDQAMAAVAAGPEMIIAASCPRCGRSFDIPFEIQDFFFGELQASNEMLYREVHYLAYHYHWSEEEILGLPRGKRRHYIGLLAEEIERLNDAAS